MLAIFYQMKWPVSAVEPEHQNHDCNHQGPSVTLQYDCDDDDADYDDGDKEDDIKGPQCKGRCIW